MGDVFLEDGYDGLDIATSGIQLGKLLEYQVLDTGYCSTSVFNLGNWGVAIRRIQQGSLETAALSILSRETGVLRYVVSNRGVLGQV